MVRDHADVMLELWMNSRMKRSRSGPAGRVRLRRHGARAEPAAGATKSLGFRSPFTQCPGRLRWRADDGGIDNQPIQVRIAGDGFEQPVEDACFNPAAIAPLSVWYGPNRSGKSRPRAPECAFHKGIEEAPAIAARPRLPLRPPGTKGLTCSHLTCH